MTWPVNHMVSPTSQTVTCGECHTRANGRLARVGGFYLPGRDRNRFVDFTGGGLILLTLAGVLIHGGGRIVASRRRRRQPELEPESKVEGTDLA